MNTDSLTDFSWSRHQINVLITSGVVENGGDGCYPACFASAIRREAATIQWI